MDTTSFFDEETKIDPEDPEYAWKMLSLETRGSF
jgi:hypothetical protein